MVQIYSALDRKGIIEDLPVESSSVDWVISNCVINLSPEKHRVFAEIARVLKPGGQMRLSDIVAERLPDWVRESEAFYSACVAGAVSEQEYVEGLRSAGLEDVAVRERLVYDESQLGGLAECAPTGAAEETDRWESVAGKVWSALIYGRKPSQAVVEVMNHDLPLVSM